MERSKKLLDCKMGLETEILSGLLNMQGSFLQMVGIRGHDLDLGHKEEVEIRLRFSRIQGVY